MYDFFPEQYGALGDGCKKDTAAIQDALDMCFRQGGGRVILSGGRTYLSGSLHMRAGVELHLSAGARLLASPDLSDYYAPGTVDTDETRRTGTPVTRKPAYAFLYGLDCQRAAITGLGVIDGYGDAFVHRVNQYYVAGDFYPRPTLVYLEHCDHLTVKDVTLCNTAFWSLHMAGCDDVLVDGIRILNPLDVANSDGIDPDHCQNVRITNCHIECADDCICLKNTQGNSEYPPTRNVLISGCTLTSTSAAIKIGTEGVGDFENVMVSGCIITRSNRGISIQIRDGGHVKNVCFRDLVIETRRFSEHWWGTGEAIAVTSIDRDEQTLSGSISGLRFENIVTCGEGGIVLYGMPGKIHDIALKDIRMEMKSISKWGKHGIDLRPGLGTENPWAAPIAAVMMKNVKDIRLENVSACLHEGFDEMMTLCDCDEIDGTVKRRY